MVPSKHDYPAWGVDFEGVEVQQTLGWRWSVEVPSYQGENTPQFQSLLGQHSLPGTNTHYLSTNRPLQTSSSGHTAGSQLFRGSFEAALEQIAHILTMDIPTNWRSLARSRQTICEERRTGNRALECNHVRLSRADVGRLLKYMHRL